MVKHDTQQMTDDGQRQVCGISSLTGELKEGW